jgi:tetratricopeptide (TPR) repeat protein
MPQRSEHAPNDPEKAKLPVASKGLERPRDLTPFPRIGESEHARTASNLKPQEELKLAYTYVGQWRDKYNKAKALDPQIRGELLQILSFAAKHLHEARSLRPDVKIDVTDDDGNPYTVTVDILAGEMLYYEALSVGGRTVSRANNEAAVVALQKAIKYRPYATDFHILLAKSYIRIQNRALAFEHVRKALELEPQDIEAHHVHDLLQSNPQTGAPQYSPMPIGSTGLYITAGIIAFLGLFIGGAAEMPLLILFCFATAGIIAVCGMFAKNASFKREMAENQVSPI